MSDKQQTAIERAEVAEDKLEMALKALQFYADAEHRAFGGDCIEDGEKARQALEDIWCLNLDLEMDGGMWCAKGHDFINLQESHAGFGKTRREAAEAYYAGADRPTHWMPLPQPPTSKGDGE